MLLGRESKVWLSKLRFYFPLVFLFASGVNCKRDKLPKPFKKQNVVQFLVLDLGVGGRVLFLFLSVPALGNEWK